MYEMVCTRILWQKCRFPGWRDFFRYEIFSGTFWSISSRFWPKICKIQWVVQKTCILTGFRGFYVERDFSRKIGLRQFECTSVLQIHAKYQKDPIPFSRKTLDRRTDGRTDIGQSIGPTSRVGGSKNVWNGCRSCSPLHCGLISNKEHLWVTVPTDICKGDITSRIVWNDSMNFRLSSSTTLTSPEVQEKVHIHLYWNHPLDCYLNGSQVNSNHQIDILDIQVFLGPPPQAIFRHFPTFSDNFRHFPTISDNFRQLPTLSDRVECRKMSDNVEFATKLPKNALKIKIRRQKIFEKNLKFFLT